MYTSFLLVPSLFAGLVGSFLLEDDPVLQGLVLMWAVLVGLVAFAAISATQRPTIPVKLDTSYVFIQGSGSYLFLDLRLAGRIVSREELLSALEGFKSEVFSDFAQGKAVDSKRMKTLAGCIICRYLLDTRLWSVDNFFSSRKLVDPEGREIPTQLWWGYALDRDIDTNVNDIVELGSGQIRLYRGGDVVSAPSDELLCILRNDGPAAAREWLDLKYPGASFFATGVFRGLERIEGVDLLPHVKETLLENLAAKTALKVAGPQGYEFGGNMAWGNGSTQGVVGEAQTLVETGLRAVSKELKEPETLDDLKLGFQRAIVHLNREFNSA